MASLRDDVVGQDDEVARLGPQLRRAPRHLGDAAVVVADSHPLADVKRLLALDREAGEGIPQRVLQREAEHDGADGGRRHELLAEERRRRSSTRPMTIASCRMSGNRSGTRSARSGLISRKTAALISAGDEGELAESVDLLDGRGSERIQRRWRRRRRRRATSRTTERRSFRRISRLTVRLMIPSITASAATPRIRCAGVDDQAHPLLERLELGGGDLHAERALVRAALGIAIGNAAARACRRGLLLRRLPACRRRDARECRSRPSSSAPPPSSRRWLSGRHPSSCRRWRDRPRRRLSVAISVTGLASNVMFCL